LKANPAVGKGFRFAERRAFRRGAFFRPLRTVLLLRAAIDFPFFDLLRGFNPTTAKCGFSINGSPP
jgi:hypothetical protein